GVRGAARLLQLLTHVSYRAFRRQSRAALALKIRAGAAIAGADGGQHGVLLAQLLLGLRQGAIGEKMGIALERQLLLDRAPGLLPGFLGRAQLCQFVAQLPIAVEPCHFLWLNPGEAGILPLGKTRLWHAEGEP